MKSSQERPHEITASGGGFTLIELMLVVAIIGILAAIAIPKFANLVIKSKEAAVRGKLGSLRSALSIYYSDNEGRYPASMDPTLTIGKKYLDAIPGISIPTVPYHRNEYKERIGSVLDAAFDGSHGVNSGAWSYFPNTGVLVVNCTDTDTKETTWSNW